ncbi:hypothetical protein C6A85_000000105000 [Mycobacterium sp. ITM-2017-0098]|nr:hypothetical protein C6A85_000000105000 [Mycobacterium sp. ITM-2017-0098]
MDSVLNRALTKDPGDRFERCADFARALSHRLTAEAPGDPGITRQSTSPVAGTAPNTAPFRSRRRTAVLVPAVLGVLLLAATVVAGVEFVRADRTEAPTAREETTTTITTATSVAPPPPAPPPPTTEVTDTVTDTVTTAPAAPSAAVIGANCAPLDSTAATESGVTAYCSSVPGSGATIWSLAQGEVPSPTSTPPQDPTEEPLPTEEAFPVLTCMEQTGQTRRECRRDIRDSNGQPPLP